MATFRDLDDEKLAELERLLQNKANTLGTNGRVVEEPFRRTTNNVSSDIWASTPNASNGLIPPDYDSYGVYGGVGTRYETVQLYSYWPSGITGPDSIQTFIVVSDIPTSHTQEEIDRVRLTNLIPPSFSPNKSNAAHTDPNVRGFELALYPAKSGGGEGYPLQPDLDKGPIPTTADPGGGLPSEMAPGLGDEGFWSVDYGNGIVRFSRPPLNGSGGVMNPNDVYADIGGNEIVDGYGAITMFATFYQYTGSFVSDINLSNFTTVGDGYLSSGTYTGFSHDTIQTALNSFSDGGTIFIKEGNYTFTDSVVVQDHNKIIGLGRVFVEAPDGKPAFKLAGSNSSIEGIIFTTENSSDGASCIALSGDSAYETIQNIKIFNNTFDCAQDAYGVEISPDVDNIRYKNIEIRNNTFKPQNNIASPKYISDRYGDGYYSIEDLLVCENTFEDTGDGDGAGSVYFNHTYRELSRFTLSKNMGKFDLVLFGPDGYSSEIMITENNLKNVTIGKFENLMFGNNAVSNDVVFGDLSEGKIYNNQIGGNLNCVLSGSVISENHIDGNLYSGTSIGCTFSSNKVAGIVTFVEITYVTEISNNYIQTQFRVYNEFNSSKFTNNTVNGATTFSSTLLDATITNGYFGSTLTIGDGVTSGTVLEDSFINDNIINGAFSVGDSLISGVAVTNSHITGNNILSGGLSIGNVVADENYPIVSSGSQINNNNVVGSLSIGGSATSASNALSGSHLNNNIVSSTLNIGNSLTTTSIIVNTSHVTGNRVGSDMNVGNSLVNGVIASASSFSGNVAAKLDIGNLLATGTVVEDCRIESNECSDFIDIGNLAGAQVEPYVALDRSSVSNNTALGIKIAPQGATYPDETVSKSNINNNTLSSTFDIRGLSASLKFVNNTVSGIATLGSISDCNISDGYFGSNLSFGSVDKVIKSNISDNIVVGNFSIQTGGSSVETAVEDSVISGNKIAGNVAVADSTATLASDERIFVRSGFNDNVVSGTVSFGASGVKSPTFFEKFVMQNNIFASTLDLYGKLDDCSASNNNVTGNVFFGALTQSTITGNRFGGTLTIADTITGGKALEESTVSHNIISGACSIGDAIVDASAVVLDYSHFIGNEIGTGAADNLTIGASLTGTTSAYIADQSSITDNIVNGSITLGNASRDDGTATYTGSVFNNNIVNNTITLNGGIDNCSIISNTTVAALTIGTIEYSTVSGNIVGGTGRLVINDGTNDSPSGGASSYRSVISGNICYGIDIGISQTTGSYVCQASTIGNNYCQNTFNIGTNFNNASGSVVFKTSIVGNVIGSITRIANSLNSASANAVRQSVISDNTFYSAVYIAANLTSTTTGRALYISLFCNNLSAGQVEMGNSGRDQSVDTIIDSVVSGCYLSQMSIYGKIRESIINENKSGGNVVTGSLEKSILSNNRIDGGLQIGSGFSVSGKIPIDRSVISGNTINSTVLLGTSSLVDVLNIYKSSFVHNVCDGSVYIGTGGKDPASISCDETKIYGNTINSLFRVYGMVETSEISNNSVLGSFEIKGMLDETMLTDGYFGGDVHVGDDLTSGTAVANSIVSRNFMSLALYAGEDITTGTVFKDSIFNDNIVDGNTAFGGSIASTGVGLVLDGSRIANNTIGGTFSGPSGRDDDTQTYLNSEISNNIFVGNTTTIGELDNCTVSNNRCDGDFQTGALADSVVSNNHVVGNMYVYNVRTNGQALYRSIISNNFIEIYFRIANAVDANTSTIIYKSEISDNILNGEVRIGSNYGGTYTGLLFGISTFSGNVCLNNVLFGDSATRDPYGYTTYSYFNLTNNLFSGTAVTIAGRMERCNVVGNFAEALNLDAVHSSIIGSNEINTVYVGTTITGGAGEDICYETGILGNNFGLLDVGTALDSTSSGNVLDRSAVLGNHIYGSSMRFGHTNRDRNIQTTYQSSVSNNYIFGDLGLYGKCEQMLINDNFCASSLITGHLEYCSVSDNFASTGMIVYTESAVTTGSVVSTSTISGNTVGGMTLGESRTQGNLIADTAISGNISFGAIDIGRGLTSSTSGLVLWRSIFSDNRVFTDTSDFGADGRTANTQTYLLSTISGNVMWNININGMMESCNVSDNTFDDATTIDAVSTQSIVSGNVFEGTMTFNGSATGTVLNSVVDGNTFKGVATFNGGAAGSILNSNISDNIFTAATTFSGGTNGTMLDSNISGNVFNNTLTIDTNGNNLYALKQSSFSSNIVQGAFTLTSGTAQFTISNGLIYDNLFISTFNIGTSVTAGNIMDAGFIDSNVVLGAANIGTALTGSTGGHVFNASKISNNAFFDTLTFGSSGRTRYTETYNESVFSNNFVYTGNTYFYGECYYCFFDGNYFESPIYIYGSFNRSYFDNNWVNELTLDEGATTPANPLYASSLRCNRFYGGVYIAPSATGASSNDILYASTIQGNWFSYNLEIANNYDSWSGEVLAWSNISDNLFEASSIYLCNNGTHSSTRLIYQSVISGNFSSNGGIYIGNAKTAGNVIEQSVISNNCFNYIDIGTSITSTTTANVLNSSVFSSNVVNTTASFASSGRTSTTDTYTDSVIIGNRFNNFYGYGRFLECSITGNVFESVRTIGSSVLSNWVGNCNPSGGTYAIDVEVNYASGYAAKFFNDGGVTNRYGIVIKAGEDTTPSGTNRFIDFLDGTDGDAGGIQRVGSGTPSFRAPSDERIKADIINTNVNGLEVLKALPLREFKKIKSSISDKELYSNPPLIKIGWVAQDVENVWPDMVSEGKDGTKSVSDTILIPILTKAIQEMSDEIDTLKEELDEIKNKDSTGENNGT